MTVESDGLSLELPRLTALNTRRCSVYCVGISLAVVWTFDRCQHSESHCGDRKVGIVSSDNSPSADSCWSHWARVSICLLTEYGLDI